MDDYSSNFKALIIKNFVCYLQQELYRKSMKIPQKVSIETVLTNNWKTSRLLMKKEEKR